MKKKVTLTITILLATLTLNKLYGAPRTSAKTHHPLVQSNKNGQFIAIKPVAKSNTAEKSIQERTMQPVKSKEVETINFL